VFLKLAIFSILRHKRRASLVILAVALTVAAMNLIGGLLAGMRANFVSSITDDGPHVSLRAEGRKALLDQSLVEPALSDSRVVEEAVRAQGARDVTSMIDVGALLLLEDGKNVGQMLVGIEPDSPYYRSVRRSMIEGSFDLQTGGIVISDAVARVLGLGVGDRATVLVQDKSQSPWYEEFHVRGVFSPGKSALGETTLFMNLDDARRMVDLDGGSTEVDFRIPDAFSVDAWLDANAPGSTETRRSSFQSANLEIETWKESKGSLLSFIGMFDVFNVMMNILFVFIASTVIANAILMSAFERIREFGTLRAIGMKRRLVAGIVMMEGAIQGLVGSLVGLAIGIPLVLYLQVHGLDWGAFTDVMGFGDTLHFQFSLSHSCLDLASGVTVALVGSLWAALSSARLSVMESLRSA